MGPTQLPIHWMSGALILRLKQHDLKVDHSPPCAEVKNEWRCTFTPPIHLQGVDRDNFSFNGPCLVLRSGIVLCAEVAVCGQARYGREAFLKLSVSLHENYFFHGAHKALVSLHVRAAQRCIFPVRVFSELSLLHHVLNGLETRPVS
jgi:hypothetical protein